MRRQEFIDDVCDTGELISFCYNHGYDYYVEDIYCDETRNELIDNEISEWGGTWWELRGYLYDLADRGDYDYWRRDDYDGSWVGIDEDEFESMKSDVLENLDNDGFFDDDDEDDEEDDDIFEPEEVLGPGDFMNAIGSIESVVPYDKVIAANLARIHAEQEEAERLYEKMKKIDEEANRLTAGDFSAVF